MIIQERNAKKEFAQELKRVRYYEGLLKTSWNYQAAHFFQNSTLHGVRYIAESGRPFFEKFMWFCCVTIGAIATMIIIVSLWGKFQTNPTITGLDTDFHSWDVAFPALTLCPVDPSNETYVDNFIDRKWPGISDTAKIKDFLTKVARLNYENMASIQNYTNDAEFQAMCADLKQLTYDFMIMDVNGLLSQDVFDNFPLQLVSHCEDIISECKWKNEEYDCCSGFFPIFTENGFCYTFNSRHYERKWPWLSVKLPPFELQYIQETDLKWAFLFNSVSPKMLVYIHDSDDVPTIDTNPQHVWDQKVNRISFSMKQTYTTSDAKQLSIEQRHCVFEDEIRLKIDKTMYTYTACTRECRMETAKRACGCVPFFYPNIDGFTYCTLKDMACIIGHLTRIKDVDECDCELGCSNTVYEVEKLTERSEPTQSQLESEFVSWPMVRYKREVLFGWVDLLVSFGGIAGLFLGFSLLSGVEIIYYFTMRACCMVYRERTEVERIQLEQSTKPRPEYDLSLTPYFKAKPDRARAVSELQEKEHGVLLKRVNRIDPFNPGKIHTVSRNDVFRPPFGIEFLN